MTQIDIYNENGMHVTLGGEPIDILTSGVWVHDGKEEIQGYVNKNAIPQINTFVTNAKEEALAEIDTKTNNFNVNAFDKTNMFNENVNNQMLMVEAHATETMQEMTVYGNSVKGDVNNTAESAKTTINQTAATAVNTVENTKNEAVNTLHEAIAEVGNPANEDLSNLSTTGEARFNAKANETEVLHKAGAEEATGHKTFSGGITASGGTFGNIVSNENLLVKAVSHFNGVVNVTYDGACIWLNSTTNAPFINFRIPDVKLVNLGLHGSLKNLTVMRNGMEYDLIEFKTPDLNDSSNKGVTTAWVNVFLKFNLFGPDFSRKITKAINTDYVSETNGWIQFLADYSGYDTYNIMINNDIVYQNNKTGLSEAGRTIITQFIATGQTWRCNKTGTGASAVNFIPCKLS